MNNENNVDVSTSVLPLDESTHAILFAFYKKEFMVIIADGSKFSNVISTYVKKTPENTLFLIMTIINQKHMFRKLIRLLRRMHL